MANIQLNYFNGSSYIPLYPQVDLSNNQGTTVPLNQIPSLSASKITSGTFSTSQIPNLDASKITSGTIAWARLPSSVSTIKLHTASYTGTNGSSTGNDTFQVNFDETTYLNGNTFGFILSTNTDCYISGFFSYGSNDSISESFTLFYHRMYQGCNYYKIGKGAFKNSNGTRAYISNPSYGVCFEKNTAFGGNLTGSYIESNPNIININGAIYYLKVFN